MKIAISHRTVGEARTEDRIAIRDVKAHLLDALTKGVIPPLKDGVDLCAAVELYESGLVELFIEEDNE